MADRVELFERRNRLRIVAPRLPRDLQLRGELIAVTMLDTENARDLAKRAGKRLAMEGVERGREEINRRAKRRRVERRLEKAAKRLPVDTPVDKRRRRRTADRAAWLVRLVLATAVIAAIYVAWRSRNRRDGTAEAGPAPDAFGAAVEASDDGEHASTVTSPEG